MSASRIIVFPYYMYIHALQVVVVQMNGLDHPSESIHILHVGKMRIKLCKGKTTVAKEYYSTSMQVLKYNAFVHTSSSLSLCFVSVVNRDGPKGVV